MHLDDSVFEQGVAYLENLFHKLPTA